LVNKKLGKPTTIRTIFPVVFVLGLFTGAILSCFSKTLLILYLIVLIFYMIIAVSFSIKSTIKEKDWKLIFIIPTVFITIHISYGIGYLIGIYKMLFKKKINVQINR